MTDDGSGIMEFMIGAIIVAALVSGALSGGLFATTGGPGEDTLLVTDGDATIEAGALTTIKSLTSVQTTLTDAVSFDGTGSMSTSTPDVTGPGEWSVCTHAAADAAVVTNNGSQTALTTDGSILRYNGSADVYEFYYWNASSRTTTTGSVAISEANATSLTSVCVIHDAGSFTVSTEHTTGTAVDGDAGGATIPTTNDWQGTIDETRLYERALTTTNRSRVASAPTQALPGSPPAARITYDTRQSAFPSSLPVYWAGTDATFDNATRVDGLTGPSLSAGTDYERNGNTLSVLSGGVLEPTGEILYVDFSTDGAPTNLARIGLVLFLLGILTVKVMEVMD